MSGAKLSPPALDYGRRAAAALMRGRKGHGGAPVASRVLGEAELVALAGLAFEAGRRAAGAAGPSLTAEQWHKVRERLVLDYLDVPAASPEGVALAAIIREIVAHYPATGGAQ